MTGYTLDITYTGPVAGGSPDSGSVVTNKKENVHAGWPIQLGAKLAPSDLASKFTWSIDGAGGNGSAAIGGYDPATGPTYVTALNPASSTGTSFPTTGSYYYVASGSENASVTPNGGGIPAAETTFSVTKPTATVSTTTSAVYVWPASGIMGFGQWMSNPPFGKAPGIVISADIDKNLGFNGGYNFIQVYAPDRVLYTADGGVFKLISGAGLDAPSGQIFYQPDAVYGPDARGDSPEQGAGGTVAKVVVADNATMWFMYLPHANGSIWVPIDSVDWSWAGTESLASGSWSLTGGTWAKDPQGSKTNTYPVWGGYRAQ